MVNLVLGSAVLRDPSRLVYPLVRKNASADDKLVEGAKVRKQLSILIHFTKTLVSNNCLKTCNVTHHLSVKIPEQQYQVLSSYSVYDNLQSFIEVSLCFITSFVCRRVALNEGGFSDLSMKPCCYYPG